MSSMQHGMHVCSSTVMQRAIMLEIETKKHSPDVFNESKF
jgi:hypothetical protein